MNTSSVESLYNAHQKIIKNTASKIKKKYGGNLEDLICDANYYFIEACKNYDSNRTDIKGIQISFEKYLKWNLWNNLLQIIKIRSVRNAILHRVDIENKDFVEKSHVLSRLQLELSKDANHIISYIISLDFTFTGKKTRRKKYLVYITRYFLSISWNMNRILKAYQEITESL